MHNVGAINHIGILMFSRDFYDVAKAANDSKSKTIPIAYLYLHSLELAIKSYLCFHCPSGKDKDTYLRKFGHNIKVAWDEAKAQGICDVSGISPDTEPVITNCNEVYSSKRLEYYSFGLITLATLEALESATRGLTECLDEHYRLQ